MLWYIQTTGLMFRFSHLAGIGVKKSSLGLLKKKHFSSLPKATKIHSSSGQKRFLRTCMYLYWKMVLVFCFGHQKCLSWEWGRAHFRKWRWPFPLSFPGYFSRNQVLNLRIKPVVWMYRNILRHFFTKSSFLSGVFPNVNIEHLELSIKFRV